MVFVKEKFENKCLVCSGNLESANIGSICNVCKDRLRAGAKPVKAG